jgi:adenylate cyclase
LNPPVPTAKPERRLTAIVSADVVGFSRLMAQDEVATLASLGEHMEIIDAIVRQHGGRVVNSVGDNVLAEFPSVVSAVTCAVEFQREIGSRNAGLPAQRRLEFRVGIHLGDVIVERDSIYGDGVNIAARLEALAEAGGIYVSAPVYDQVLGKIPEHFENLG